VKQFVGEPDAVRVEERTLLEQQGSYLHCRLQELLRKKIRKGKRNGAAMMTRMRRLGRETNWSMWMKSA
jgi:hypothetical protein